MRDLLITAIVFLSIPYILQRPYIGILVWSWLGYMNPHRLTYGFAYSFPFAYIVAIATIISIFLSKDKKTIPITSVTITLTLFILVMILSTVFALYPDQAFGELTRYIKLQTGIFLTMMLITTRERIEKLLWVIFGSIGFFGIKGGIYTLVTGGSARIYGPPGTFFGGNNSLGVALLMILPIAFYLRSTLTNLWGKRLMLVAMLLCFISIVSTYSRGAFLGMITMLFYFWWKSKGKLLTGIILLIVIVLSISFMPEQYIERLNTIETYEEDSSAMGRINAWGMAINLASDRVFGGGFKTWTLENFIRYAPVADDVHDAHSIIFEVLGELGFPGLILFIMLHLLNWTNSRWIINNAKNIDEIDWCSKLTSMLQVSLVGYYAGGMFLGLAFWDLPYHLIAIVVMIKLIMLKQPVDTENNKQPIDNKKKWPWEN